MANIVLKIDVDTLRGTQVGMPNLARMIRAAGGNATFLFSLGKDHTGWALRRVFRPGFLQKVSRTSVIEHYGYKTLMYGTLIPGPDIGKRCTAELRAIAADGFETGIHTWDHVLWQDNVRNKDAAWTQKQMQAAHQRFSELLGSAPITHGAAGWQMNEAAFAQIDAWGMTYASDGRADASISGQALAPYIPSVQGKALRHVQMPTTLPTLDELIGVDDITLSNVAAHILAQTANSNRDEVFTLHAELEGQKLAPIFKELLNGWRAQGHRLVSMGDYFQSLDRSQLPVLPVVWGQIPGRSGDVIVRPAA